MPRDGRAAVTCSRSETVCLGAQLPNACGLLIDRIVASVIVPGCREIAHGLVRRVGSERDDFAYRLVRCSEDAGIDVAAGEAGHVDQPGITLVSRSVQC